MFVKNFIIMKKIFILSLSIIALVLFVSCSKSSPDETPALDDSVPTTYYPLKVANYWNYDVQNQASNNTPTSTNTPASSGTDHLYVDSDVTIGGVAYKKMATSAAAYGFFSSILKDNNLRIDGTRLRATGTLTNNLIPTVPITVSLTDFIILKDNAVSGTALSTANGVVNQTVSGYPLTFTYTLTSYGDGTLANLTSNGVAYTNVKKTRVELNMTITGVYLGFPITILPAQNVVVSTLHFASGKGMVYDNRVINYALNASLPPTITNALGVPSSSNQQQEEYLTTSDVSH
jgi:hypothetical protein